MNVHWYKSWCLMINVNNERMLKSTDSTCRGDKKNQGDNQLTI